MASEKLSRALSDFWKVTSLSQVLLHQRVWTPPMPVPTYLVASSGVNTLGTPVELLEGSWVLTPLFALRYGPVWLSWLNNNISLFLLSSRNRKRVDTLIYNRPRLEHPPGLIEREMNQINRLLSQPPVLLLHRAEKDRKASTCQNTP
jgi:hypothetical protein